MNYIGSKLKLCQEFIPQTIKAVCGSDLSEKTFCDLFAGTGIVGRTFKTRVKKVIANDIEYYSYVLNKNYIENHEEIADKYCYIDALNCAELIDDGFIYKNYCLGGSGSRQFFSDHNGKKIDSIRTQIKKWQESCEITPELYYFLLCSLLESADKVANTASVYGAYLKHLKNSARKELVLLGSDFELNSNKHEVYQEDANTLITKIEGDILYLDPPYNTRQYGANYHLLNTIARYDDFVPKGKTGLPDYNRSKYCSSSSVADQFDNLVRNANFKYIFLSYNNEGLMSSAEIQKIMSRYGRYDVAKTEYQRFKADSGRKNKFSATTEYLHILEK